MYESIFGFYLMIFPISLIATFLFPFPLKSRLIALRATAQVSLMVYSLFLVRQLIGLYQMTHLMHMQTSAKDYFGSSTVEMLCMILLPIFFIVKRIRNGYLLGLILWILFLHAQLQKEFLYLGSGIYFVNAILFYFSLMLALYAVLWLLQTLSKPT